MDIDKYESNSAAYRQLQSFFNNKINSDNATTVSSSSSNSYKFVARKQSNDLLSKGKFDVRNGSCLLFSIHVFHLYFNSCNCCTCGSYSIVQHGHYCRINFDYFSLFLLFSSYSRRGKCFLVLRVPHQHLQQIMLQLQHHRYAFHFLSALNTFAFLFNLRILLLRL